MDVKDIRNNFQKDIQDLNVDELHIKYLGKNGVINKLFEEISKLKKNKRIDAAKEVNLLKVEITEKISENSRTGSLDKKVEIDLTIPVETKLGGNLHPITLVSRELNNFFHYYGFSVGEGPEIESDYYNFEMMGVPKDHPARELQDTLYILEGETLLRTHTSSVEARYLSENTPPIRVVLPGKVYRNETNSKTNASFFHQYQGFYVDKNVTLGHLKWIFDKALKFILGQDTEIRFRSKYYPEVQPCLSPDIKCKFCHGEGCEVCKYRGWIEIAGGGIIHPETMEKAGINYKEYSGFAFGMGLDRIAMNKYGINDLRVMFNSKLVYK